MSFSFKTLWHNLFSGTDSVNLPSDATPQTKPPEADSVLPPAQPPTPPPPQEPSCFIKGVLKSIELNPEQWKLDFESGFKWILFQNSTLDITMDDSSWCIKVGPNCLSVTKADKDAIFDFLMKRRQTLAAPTIRAMEALGCPTAESATEPPKDTS